ncbi:putative wsc domain-containing protein [Golovinomyces cichoracearum]|uniref:Putative wsc domain-containing protein n=1 Tax=Golovinomyces cichoracearum TaxID=62708 RepID=A0A420II73_9PEZI|nr:putative wsc domain-containing protein [Golovinomyces cichoracearum]
MRRPTYSIAGIAATLLMLANQSSAFWRMGCRSRTGLVRIDPLVSPGRISEHMHAIHGSSGFSETATYEELMSGDCTSCEVAEDKSAYWHPALYFQDSSTGKFTLVPQVGGMLAYYLLNPNPGNTSITSFPAGFQMIAGDSNQRNFSYPVPDVEKSYWNQQPYNSQAFLRQAAVGFNCLNYDIAPEGSLYRHFMPDKSFLDEHCPQGIRFELMFPSCWNGLREIPPNKMDHVAYPSLVMSGECPKEFPVRLPSLFYEIIWDTYAFKDRQGQFVIANGDTTGYGFHGDFIMGWDEKFLQKAVDTCTNLSGKTSDCPLFTLQDPSVMESCNLTNVPLIAAKEQKQVQNLNSLPGNVKIEKGPQYSSGEAPGDFRPPVQVLPSARPDYHAENPKPEPELKIEPPTNNTGDLTPDSSPKQDMDQKKPEQNIPKIDTPVPAPPPPAKASEVVKVIWVEETVTVTETVTIMLPHQKRSHMQQHLRRFEGYHHNHGHPFGAAK